MPELPEVETVRRGLAPHLLGQTVTAVVVRQPCLRWPVATEWTTRLPGQTLEDVERRAKYLLLHTGAGIALCHLGMSGRLRILPAETPLQKHDHVDVLLANGQCLRFNDSRRFGALLWSSAPAGQHPLLRELGPEPLGEDFSATDLHVRSRGRRVAVKAFIMDQRIVVGVGNIYASEALFAAGIHPLRPAGALSIEEYARLVAAIRAVLEAAIRQGGTTLRDFVGGDGQSGYFQQELQVYGRDRQPCRHCGGAIQRCRIGQRTSYYCPRCQS